MDKASGFTRSEARAALLAGGEEWQGAVRAVEDTPGLLAHAEFTEADLSNRDLAELDLSHCDFYKASLQSANLKKSVLDHAEVSHAQMRNAALYKASLVDAILLEADLQGADLSSADCRGADFRGVNLRGANLSGANLRHANFSHADLSGTDLSGADVTGAKFHFAKIADANVTHIRYGTFRDMVGLYYGLHGVDQTFGNAQFVRDAKDQDYIDSLFQAIQDKPPGLVRRIDLLLFHAWSLIDHGRSLAKVSYYAFLIAMLYGLIYLMDMIYDWKIMDYSNSAGTWFTPFYYSVVTYTTLGYGDVTANSLFGEILVISEVIVGYFTLGLLLAILANTIARRS